MEYPLPQFLEVKPKIAGPFNFRQLIYIISGGIVATVFYFMMSSVVMFLFVGIPIMGIALILAFVKVKGFPITTIMMRSFSFIFVGKKYIWKKTEKPALTMPQAKKEEEEKIDMGASLEIAGKSRLKQISKLIEIHPK